MIKYHKIQSVFKRDPDTNFKTFKENEYTLSEFDYLKDNQWEMSEKVDGMNVRVIFDGSSITFEGKDNNSMIPASLVNRLVERFIPQLELFKGTFPDGVCFYCEGYGPGIQKGGNYREDQDVVLFDVLIDEWWLKRDDVNSIALQFGFGVVPIFCRGTLLEAIAMAKSGIASRWGNFTAEGIVARPMIELKARNGERIITKIKHKDFKKTA